MLSHNLFGTTDEYLRGASGGRQQPGAKTCCCSQEGPGSSGVASDGVVTWLGTRSAIHTSAAVAMGANPVLLAQAEG